MSKLGQTLYRFRGFILGIFAIALLATDEYTSFANSWNIVMLVALLLFLSGIALRIKTRQFIGEHTRKSTHQAEELVTWGPYAFVRHPLYVSNTLIAVAIIFFHLGPSFLVIPFTLAVSLFEWALSRIEDKFLHEKFGKEWEDWANGVEALNIGIKVFFGKGLKKTFADYRAKKPFRTVWQSFWADRSTWAWLMFYNLLLILKKVYLT